MVQKNAGQILQVRADLTGATRPGIGQSCRPCARLEPFEDRRLKLDHQSVSFFAGFGFLCRVLISDDLLAPVDRRLLSMRFLGLDPSQQRHRLDAPLDEELEILVHRFDQLGEAVRVAIYLGQ
jgi:hypothetical protein